jgi:hypothetical protein
LAVLVGMVLALRVVARLQAPLPVSAASAAQAAQAALLATQVLQAVRVL